MKKLFFTLALGLFVNLSFAQNEAESIVNQDSTDNADTIKAIFGGYGGPFVGATTLNKDLAIIVGGRGGFIMNHRFVFGGIGGAIIGTKEQSANIYQFDSTGINKTDTIAGSRSISMGTGGVYFEYIINYNSPVHISIPINIQVGGVSAGKKNSAGENEDDLKIKTSSVFIVEPGISFEFNVNSFFIPSFNVGYRFVTGSYSKELSGVYGALMFKFGSF
ncbi:conserved hypothetical protein [sediment metagenome]|uniref:Outer membrane protein beta-barrel domain-containing protein n=1 Tax=sediment metagenome TaxID=749907 RepID=D9PHT4_9ZZZZ